MPVKLAVAAAFVCVDTFLLKSNTKLPFFLCFLTNLIHCPWFLNEGLVKLFQPSFLHAAVVAGWPDAAGSKTHLAVIWPVLVGSKTDALTLKKGLSLAPAWVTPTLNIPIAVARDNNPSKIFFIESFH